MPGVLSARICSTEVHVETGKASGVTNLQDAARA